MALCSEVKKKQHVGHYLLRHSFGQTLVKQTEVSQENKTVSSNQWGLGIEPSLVALS